MCWGRHKQICLLIVAASLQAGQGAIRQVERAALLKLGGSLKHQTDIGPALLWQRDQDHCLWRGIVCSAAGEVTDVMVEEPHLESELDAARPWLSHEGLEAVAALDKLRSLDIVHHGMEPGGLPDSWAGLQHLEVLSLKLEGRAAALPGAPWAYPGSFPSLLSLSFRGWAFHGTLPAAWASPGAFPKLQSLIVASSNLAGSLPPEWAASGFPSLLRLVIEAGGLTGRFPGEWLSATTAFPSLRSLELSGCARWGELPYRVVLPFLSKLSLDSCGLSGTLPDSWGREGHLAKLELLSLSQNSLRGPLPASWLCAGLPALGAFYIYDNMNTSLPSCCPRSTSPLMILHVADNRLRGTLPFTEQQCRNGTALSLRSINLSGNGLTGTLPTNWPTTLPGLVDLYLDGNALSDKELPSTWADPAAFPVLLTLSLDDNSFPWTVPLVLLKKLTLGDISLAGCGLRGPLPPLAGFFPPVTPHVGMLNLSRNLLTGRLPSDWAALPKFSTTESLDLSYNHLTGPIPGEWMGSAWQPVIQLQGNNLSGPLPLPPQEGSFQLEVVPGNEGLCWPKAAAVRKVLGKPVVCGPPFVKNLSKRAECRQVFDICALEPAAAGMLTQKIRLVIVALLAGFNFTLLVLAFKRRCFVRRNRKNPPLFPSLASVELTGSQGRIGSPGHELLLPEAAEELEALLRADDQGDSSSAPAGPVSDAAALPLSLPGFAQHEGLQALLLAQKEAASSSTAPAAWQGARRSRLGLVRLKDLQFCRSGNGALELLGQGASGAVFKAELAGSGAVAVKVLRRQSVDEARLWREAEIMHSCRHSSILELVGVCEAGGLLMLVTEFVERGSLETLLHLPELRWHARGQGLLLEVAQALQHLHFRNVLHADIKPQNVLVTYHWHAKVADVGTARYLKSGIASACGGTILYAAPEQLLGLPCTAAADIFSLGLLMLAVVVGQAGQVRGLCRSPRVPEDCPADVAQLIAACLETDPGSRPTAAQVVEVLLSSSRN